MEIAILGINLWEDFDLGIKAAAKKHNIDARYINPSMSELKGNLNEIIPKWQTEKIKEVMKQGVQAIAFCALHPAPLVPIIKEAINSGIFCITYDIDGPETGRYFHIGTNNYLAGKIAGNNIASLLQFKGDIIIDSPSLTSQSCKDRIQGFKDAISNYKNIKILELVSCEEDMNKIFSLSTQVLQKYNNLNGIYSTTGISARIMAQAVKFQGRSGMKFVCFDAEQDTVKFLQEGVIDVIIAQRIYDMGFKTVEYLYRVLKFGKDEVLKTIPESKFIDTGVDVVNLENLAKYKNELKEQGIPVGF